MRHLIFHHVRIEPVEEVYAVGSAGQSVGNHGEADSLLLLRSNPSDGHIVHSCVTFYTVFADTSEGIFHKVVVHPVVRYQNIGILFGKPRLGAVGYVALEDDFSVLYRRAAAEALAQLLR